MDESIKKYLLDIFTAIEEIESFFGDKPKFFEDFIVIYALDVL